MGDLSDGGLNNGWDDVIHVYSSPTSRGYCSDDVLPNLFVSNHDGFRVADHFYDNDDEINVKTVLPYLPAIPDPSPFTTAMNLPTSAVTTTVHSPTMPHERRDT